MTMTTNPFTQGQALWNEHEDYINRTAQSIARSYVKVEEEDVLQEIYLFLWEKEPAFLENNCSDRYVRTCIKNVARNYAQKQRDQTLLDTDKFYYSFDEVRELLPAFFSGHEDWNTTTFVDSTGQTYDPRDSLSIMCDFSLVYQTLNESHKNILVRKYGMGEELLEAKDRQQASRALKKFVLTLNSETDKRAKAHDGPGSRKAISSTQGIHKAKVNYLD